ncbi:MAG TPA: SAF domain-containing protein [Acidimicrobiales bacterium]|nr:SAF domain-containing protein [Acidimicrobiales bacterium]
MNRRIAGIAGAVVLAIIGTLVLVSYVQSARDQALSDEELVEVWVVRTSIAEGASAADIAGSLERREVPARLRAEGSVTELDAIEGLVTRTDLVPGEQLLRSRFVTPVEARRGDVPEGLLQVTVDLAPQRALGGQIRPGDTVGVLMSFSPFDLEGTLLDEQGGTETQTGKTGNTTHLALHQVLVTSVQIGPNAAGVPAVAGEDDAVVNGASVAVGRGVASAPTESLLVTLALDAPSVERVVFAAEFGTIWLTAEGDDALEEGTRVVGRGNVYGGAQ